MKVQEGLFLVAIFFSLACTQLVKGQHQPGENCQNKCGNITIEYPFGISSGCYYPGNESFSITCKEDRPHVLSDIEVANFNHSGQLQVLLNRSSTCYDKQGNVIKEEHGSFTLENLSLSPNNKLTLVGCNALTLLSTFGMQNYSTGCMSFCDSSPAANGECDGRGCCSTDVSAPLDSDYFIFSSVNSTDVHSSLCTYAFLVEDDKFNFSSSEDLLDLRNVMRFPVLLDWSIGNQTCEQVGSTSICGGNSTCLDSTPRNGYICRCNEGFDGNPYLSAGCQDVNECTTSSTIHRHNCSDPKTCRNKVGGFYCKCQSGYRLDTPTMSCKRKEFAWTTILLVTTIGLLVILLGVGCILQSMKHRKDTELRQQFFEQNGGGMLTQRLSGAGPSNVDVKIFTEEGMKKATNGYDESRILGQGGQGTVYKGILPDNSIVAIKKARLGGDSSQVEQFINEVLVLSQINHRNVVKLLGCCLETEVPLLVYEFITNGTLFNHLHGSMFDSLLTWEHRLRIAIEVAGTLAYLHSSASIPIIHRDVKTANILLDENLTAKVADFGASRLIPMDKEELATMVQGTLGYLDPEYYNTGLLNEKSDVYSFGVVLMELLSGQKALCSKRPQSSKHLVSYFASVTNENRLHEIIDGQVMNEDNLREIQEVARIAAECTRLMGEERPRMKEVAAELEASRVKTTKHKWSDQYPEENEHLIGGHILSAQGETSSSIGYDSIKNVAILDIETGR
ncbi:EGF-like domain [Arabidopsis suecica]|uniref:Wall-associated receptor kinase-like n=1 Tax=Arabidopsis suecica TaxID=45249 RepID=A0A8T2CLP6_ARASU|nr:EGF-like domain [Arabidopsis suecica]